MYITVVRIYYEGMDDTKIFISWNCSQDDLYKNIKSTCSVP
jgi:hypothetical protein